MIPFDSNDQRIVLVLTCDGGEFQQVSVEVDVDAGAVEGQGDACAVLPHC